MSSQSNIVSYTRAVMNGKYCIQMLYGDNGIDTRKVEAVSISAVKMDNNEIYDLCKGSVDKKTTQFLYEQLIELRDKFREVMFTFENSDFNFIFSDKRYVPINIRKYYR